MIRTKVLIFHHRICPWYLVFCVWLAVFQPPHCGWTGAGPRLSLKCLNASVRLAACSFVSSLVYIHPATHFNPFENRASQYSKNLNPFWSVLTFLVSVFIFFPPSSTGLRAPGCSVSGFTCSEWEAIHGNLSWVEAERAYRLLCLWKNRQLWGTCLHPRKPCEGAAKGTCMWTSYGIVLVKLWPCASLQSPIISTSVQVGLRIFCWLDTPERGTFCSRKEAFSLFCFIQIGLFDQWLLSVFLPSCHFFF